MLNWVSLLLSCGCLSFCMSWYFNLPDLFICTDRVIFVSYLTDL